ncbi:MAG: lipid-A-disaccharide synthase [Deltaproteobacteria bacterium]|nr:lipid-A-disaccharide synthase [Deltaproteobacteria bacterium]
MPLPLAYACDSTAALVHTNESKSVLIIAGEASADLHGALVLRALHKIQPQINVFGIGGNLMCEAGLNAIAKAEDISVGGFTEVIFAIPRIFGILRRITNAAAINKPNVAVLIDLPDFNLRLASRLKRLRIPIIYYISPQLWAWRPKRVAQIRKLVDRMLVILPFEEEFYRQHNVVAEFVGHPLVEELPLPSDHQTSRKTLDMDANSEQVIALLPGSRKQEVTRHLPIMLEGLNLLQQQQPDLQALIPIASTIPRSLVEAILIRSGAKAKLLDGQASTAISAADVAVVCSGTATLQTALLLRPMVVVYRVSWLTYHILKRLIRVAHIALVNLIAGKPLVTELIQHTFTPHSMAAELQHLLTDANARRQQENELAAIRAKLGEHGAAQRVAEVIGEYLNSNQISIINVKNGESHA